MTAMIAGANQQNISSNHSKKTEHQRSDTLQTTRSDKSLKERYKKLSEFTTLNTNLN
jgi:hypothetical protein